MEVEIIEHIRPKHGECMPESGPKEPFKLSSKPVEKNLKQITLPFLKASNKQLEQNPIRNHSESVVKCQNSALNEASCVVEEAEPVLKTSNFQNALHKFISNYDKDAPLKNKKDDSCDEVTIGDSSEEEISQGGELETEKMGSLLPSHCGDKRDLNPENRCSVLTAPQTISLERKIESAASVDLKSSDSSDEGMQVEEIEVNLSSNSVNKISSDSSSPNLLLVSKRKRSIKSIEKQKNKIRRVQEREMRKLEKEKIKAEKERCKAEVEKLRKELAEAKEKEREERERDKLEKMQKRKAEIEQKLEERKIKEEERKIREEEKKRTEEEMHKKRQKSKEVFINFFKKSSMDTSEKMEDDLVGKFKPFELKENMRLAPVIRRSLSDLDLNPVKADNFDVCDLYLACLRKKDYLVRTSERTFPVDESLDLEILEEERDKFIIDGLNKIPHLKAKLFQFCENHRPPYWGTWQKKSCSVTGRKPFSKDACFDYLVDSDEEWDSGDEEPGENLDVSENEKESEDEYEVDNDFFVPHGYLSDDENNDDDVMTPEDQKLKLKMREVEFEKEIKKKTTQIKPRLIGCVWMSSEDPKTLGQLSVLKQYRAVFVVGSGPVPTSYSMKEDNAVFNDGSSGTREHSGSKASSKIFPDLAMEDLIRLVCGNKRRRKVLVLEFQTYWRQKGHSEATAKHNVEPLSVPIILSKRQIDLKIQEISTYERCVEEGPLHGQKCWMVQKVFRDKYLTSELILPNNWTFCTEVKPLRGKLSSNKPSCATPLISRFTKKRDNTEEVIIDSSPEKLPELASIPGRNSVKSEEPRTPSIKDMLTKLVQRTPGSANRPVEPRDKRQPSIKSKLQGFTFQQNSEPEEIILD